MLSFSTHFGHFTDLRLRTYLLPSICSYCRTQKSRHSFLYICGTWWYEVQKNFRKKTTVSHLKIAKNLLKEVCDLRYGRHVIADVSIVASLLAGNRIGDFVVCLRRTFDRFSEEVLPKAIHSLSFLLPISSVEFNRNLWYLVATCYSVVLL